MALRTLRCLVDALADDAEGEAIIAHHADTPTVWTRQQLHDEIERFARDLIAAGVGAGEPVALIASSRPEWAVAMLAIARSRRDRDADQRADRRAGAGPDRRP